MKQLPICRVSLVRDGSMTIDSAPIQSPSDVAKIVTEYIGQTDREHVVVVFLNNRNKPIGINTVAIGTVSASLVHPREVFKPAILASASSIILAHNHPSGEVEPSDHDIAITKRIKQGGELLGIELLDHLIVGGGGACASFRAMGLIEENKR